MSSGFVGKTQDFLAKNTQYETSDVTSALANISDDIYHTGQAENSIFTLDENTEMTYEQFLEMMSDASQISVANLNQEEMEMLFNILNSSGDDNVLSYDELKILAKGNEISDFSMWMAIAGISDEEVNKKSSDSSSTGTTGTTGTNGTTWSGPKFTEEGKYDFSDPATSVYYIDLMREEGDESPKDVADRLLKNGDISEEEYAKIKSSYYNLTSEQQAKVEAKMKQKGITFEEAIKELGFEDSNTFDKPFPMDSDEVGSKADKIYDAMSGAGTDEKSLKDVLNDPDISDADFVEVMKDYLGFGADGIAKGSLIQHLDSDLSAWSTDMTEQEAMELVGERLLNEAMKGNQDAIDIICLELMNGTSGMNGTAEHFVNYIFENASPEMLAKIVERYPQVNPGKTLAGDIKGDFSWASGIFGSGHSQNWYLDKINEAT